MDLKSLLSPRSVAVVGASKEGSRGAAVVRNLRDVVFEGPIYPVNPRYENVLDMPCFPTLQAIPHPVDLAVLVVPAEGVVAVLEDAHAKGIRAAVVISSGFAEAGEEGRQRQVELEAFLARTGMAICGPNCLGVINFIDKASGYYSTSPKDVVRGDVALVSQSGSVVVAMCRTTRPVGFSHLISSGNEAAVSSADYLHFLAGDPRVKVLAAFIEGFRKPARFIEAAEAARAGGKPLVVLKTGRSELGSAATAAHTGSLAGSSEVQRALFRQKSVVQVDDLEEMMQTIEIFRHAKAPTADGLGFIGVSGGENGLVLDIASDVGLKVPPLSEAGKKRLQALLPWFGRPENPIDATGGLANTPDKYEEYVQILLDEPAIGIVAINQDSPSVFDAVASKAAANLVGKTSKPIVYLNNFSGTWTSEVEKTLRDAGVACLSGVRPGLKAIKALIDWHSRPQVSPHVAARDTARRQQAQRYLAGGAKLLTEDLSKSLLSLYGFPAVPETVVLSTDAAVHAAAELGYPVVAKVISGDLAHKAAVGGVRLGLSSAEEVRDAIEGIKSDIAAKAPQARIEGFLIQPMIRSGLEVILGLKRDPQFGPTLVFGLGGVFVEAIRAVSLRVAPISEADAREMIDEVPALKAMLRKSHPKFDPAATLAPLLLKLSELAMEIGDLVDEIDMNPLILDPVTGKAALVDALIVGRAAS